MPRAGEQCKGDGWRFVLLMSAVLVVAGAKLWLPLTQCLHSANLLSLRELARLGDCLTRVERGGPQPSQPNFGYCISCSTAELLQGVESPLRLGRRVQSQPQPQLGVFSSFNNQCCFSASSSVGSNILVLVISTKSTTSGRATPYLSAGSAESPTSISISLTGTTRTRYYIRRTTNSSFAIAFLVMLRQTAL